MQQHICKGYHSLGLNGTRHLIRAINVGWGIIWGTIEYKVGINFHEEYGHPLDQVPDKEFLSTDFKMTAKNSLVFWLP